MKRSETTSYDTTHNDQDTTKTQTGAVIMGSDREGGPTATATTVAATDAAAAAEAVWKIHGALIFGQVCFGVGSVITALGLPAVPPFVFALYREIAAGMVLILASYLLEHASLLELMAIERAQATKKRHSSRVVVQSVSPSLAFLPITNKPDERNNNTNINNNKESNTATLLDHERSSSHGSTSTQQRPFATPRLVQALRHRVVRTTRRILEGSHPYTSSLSVLLPRRDWWRFVLLGGVVYGNQACFVTGIKLAGPVAGAIWQPSQPLITAALSMLLGYEPVNPRRIVAIVLSLSGCIFMVVVAAASSSSAAASTNKVSVSIDTAAGIVQSNNHNNQYRTNDDEQQQQQQQRIWMGNVLFFINCLCTSVFILLSRTKAFQRYPPLFITATTYAIAAIIMIPTAILVSVSESLSNFFCPECPFDVDAIAITTASSSSATAAASSNYWSIPPSAMGALFYNVIFTSVIAYGILMWANKKSKTGTMVMAYTVLQPVTASILTVLLVHVFHLVPDCATNTHTSHRKISTAAATEEDVTACLTPPGWDAVIGTIAVLMGLLLVIDTEPKSNASSSSLSGSENKALHPAPAGGIVLLETKTKEIMDTTDNTLHNRSKSNTEFDLLLPRSLTESSF